MDDGSSSSRRRRDHQSSRKHLTIEVPAPTPDPARSGRRGSPAPGLPASASGERTGEMPAVVAGLLADPERRVGRHVLIDEVGRGGMGMVLRAWDLELQRHVALKMLLPELREKDHMRQRFAREARAAANLGHPGIVSLLEVGEHEGSPFLVMDLVEGPSLMQRLERERALPPREAATIALAIAEALEHAHGKGVVHRDVKPSNVLLDAGGRPHLTDFGLARQNADPVGLTKTGTFLGTAGYVPPEQISGRLGEIGPASDIYALGAILYHTLAGRLPFEGESTVNILVSTVRGEPRPLREVDARIPEALERIVMRCLRKDPKERYGSARELARELRRWLDGAGEPAGAPPARREAVDDGGDDAETDGRVTVDRRVLFAAGVLIVGLAVGLVVAVAGARRSAPRGAGTAAGPAASDAALSGLPRVRAEAQTAISELTPALWDEVRAIDDPRLDADRFLAIGLRALRATGRWQALAAAAGGGEELASARAASAEAVRFMAHAAIRVEAWEVAREAYAEGEARGLPEGAITEGRAALEAAHRRAERESAQRINQILDDLRSGKLLQSYFDGNDALAYLAAHPSPEATARLAVALDEIALELSRVQHDVLLDAAVPDPTEAAAGERSIAGLSQVITECRNREPGHPHEGEGLVLVLAARRRLDARARRLLGDQAPPGFELAAHHLISIAQREALGDPRLIQANFICEALGRMRIAPNAVEALGRYLAAEADESGAALAARSLINIGGDEALDHVREALRRFGSTSRFGQRVRPALERAERGQ